MNTINHILVVMDPASDHQPALIQAMKIAKKTSAMIELFVVAYNSDFVSHWNFNNAQLASLQKEFVSTKLRWLETYVTEAKVQGIYTKLDVIWHPNFTSAVIAKANSSKVALVIKSTKQYSTIKKIFFTPSDWQLLEHCPVPLLLTKSLNDGPYNKVMAAVDPTRDEDKLEELDRKIISVTKAIADLFDGDAHICHCFKPIGIELWQGMSSVGMDHSLVNGDFNDYSEAIRQHHQIALAKLTSEYDFDKNSCHLAAGLAEIELPELVKSKNVDLLVMGMSNNGKFIGNMVEKVLDNVECDILSLK
jgi:nucleotide-binding universal stress UspA family protein